MDVDREYELESAGIDAFDFSLMDDDEKRAALEDAGLDPDDHESLPSSACTAPGYTDRPTAKAESAPVRAAEKPVSAPPVRVPPAKPRGNGGWWFTAAVPSGRGRERRRLRHSLPL